MSSTTAAVRDELTRRVCTSTSARRAELASLLRFGGGLRVLNGRILVQAEVPWRPLAVRLCTDILDLFGHHATVTPVHTGTHGTPHRWTVRVTDDAEVLARQTGLLDRRGRPVVGLPAEVVGGRAEDAAAAWRGAFLATGAVRDTAHTSSVVIECPGPEAALALVGAARRLGIKARNHERRTTRLVVVRDDDSVAALLTHMGLKESLDSWREHTAAQRQRLPVRPPNLGDANRHRANQAATATAVQVQWAMRVVGDTAPPHWVTAAQLRVQHPQATLEQLGRLADPPMSKNAVAGRIRRLIAMADRTTAARDGSLVDLRPAVGPAFP